MISWNQITTDGAIKKCRSITTEKNTRRNANTVSTQKFLPTDRLRFASLTAWFLLKTNADATIMIRSKESPISFGSIKTIQRTISSYDILFKIHEKLTLDHAVI